MNLELVLVHIFENRDKTSCNGISIEIEIVLICNVHTRIKSNYTAVVLWQR